MKNLETDYQKDSKLLRFWRQIHAEILHEGTHQIFRTWIMKDWKREWNIKTLFLEKQYNPKEYVENFIKEMEEEEAKIK